MLHQQSNNSNYQLPLWSKKPRDADEWFLEEIKNGVVVNKHKLDLPVITFGRIPYTSNDNGGGDRNAFKFILTAHESECKLYLSMLYECPLCITFFLFYEELYIECFSL